MPLRVAIVHHAEPAPFDPDYRAARYGRLAEFLTRHGAQVVRICPSYAFHLAHQRPMAWCGKQSDEGLTWLVQTRSFTRSRSVARFAFLRDLCRETKKYLKQAQPFDLIITGYPPPGMVNAIRHAVGPQVPVIADIRDLWPDALIPSGRLGRWLSPIARVAGHLLALELRRTDSVVALSSTMAQRAPRGKRVAIIPIGMARATANHDQLWPGADTPFVFVFVGSFAPLFDFKALIDGWQRFQANDANAAACRLRIYGAGQRQGELESLAAGVAGLSLEGWIPPNKIGECLAAADVGVSPTRDGQGTTLGNKVQEYLDAGLFLLTSLEPKTAEPLADEGLGIRVASDPDAWAGGFTDTLARRGPIRRERARRQEKARAIYGHAASERLWQATIESTLGRPLGRP